MKLHFNGKVACAALALALLATQAHAASTFGDVVRLSAGANGVWLYGTGSAFPADFEASGNASASLSPHLSGVGSVAYGFSHSYVRYDAGFRVTATDVENPNFNVYLGVRYRGGSKDAVRPSEWAPDAGFGWKPNPVTWPNIVVGADAGYGLESERVITYLAVRYLFPLNR